LPSDLPNRQVGALPGQLIRVLVDADRTRLVTLSANGALQIWKLPDVTQVGATVETGGSGGSLALSADGTRVVCGGQNRRVVLLDLATGSPRGAFALARPVAGIGLSGDGRRILTATGAEVRYEHYLRTLHVLAGPIEVASWDAATGKPLAPPRTLPGTKRIARFSADGNRLFVGREDNDVIVHDVESGRELQVLPGVGTPPEVSGLDHSGRYLATASHFHLAPSGRTEVGVWDLHSG
jgi:WD40 repeat protein